MYIYNYTYIWCYMLSKLNLTFKSCSPPPKAVASMCMSTIVACIRIRAQPAMRACERAGLRATDIRYGKSGRWT